MKDFDFMGLAIEITKKGLAQGQSPFGSVIVSRGEVVAQTHNTVWRDCDPTAHAEVNCIRAAAKVLSSIDMTGATLYSTCEPCPMCLTAIHWAKMDRVVFGATIADAQSTGFAELTISAKQMVQQGGSPLKVEDGLRREECADLFRLFLAKAGKVY